MLVAAQNNCFIQVKSAYTKSNSDILRIASIQDISSVDLADYAQITGVIVSIPDNVTIEGFTTKDITVGDIAIFRYDLVHDFKQVDDEIKFRHRVWYDAQEYWSCSIEKIFGVIRDDEIIMINGYVMLYDFKEPKLYSIAGFKRSRKTQTSRVMHIGYPREGQNHIPIYENDNVFFDAKKTAKYKIGDKSFRIIQQKDILGKQV